MSVIKVTSGGLAISKANTPYGYPCVLSTNGYGVPVTVVTSGGLPVADATIGGGIFAGIQLSNATFTVGSAQGSAIGTLSATGGTGTYTFSLTDSASNKTQVAGTNGVNLQVGATVATPGSFSITVTTTGGVPNFTQAFLITVLSIPPSNSGGANLPVISGSTVVLSTLTVTTGTWAGNPVPTYAYQWKSAGINVGTNANTYQALSNDVGNTITCTVTATNVGGSASATSAATAAITGTAPNNSTPPVISGSAIDGQVLSSSIGTWTGIPSPSFTYQWKRGATNVGTGLSTYLLVTADVGSNMTCVVTGTNVAGSANATSNALGPVAGTGGGGATPTYEIYFF